MQYPDAILAVDSHETTTARSGSWSEIAAAACAKDMANATAGLGKVLFQSKRRIHVSRRGESLRRTTRAPQLG